MFYYYDFYEGKMITTKKSINLENNVDMSRLKKSVYINLIEDYVFCEDLNSLETLEKTIEDNNFLTYSEVEDLKFIFEDAKNDIKGV